MMRPSDLKSDRLSCSDNEWWDLQTWSLIGWVVILVIMNVETFRPEVIGWAVILVICWDLQTWSLIGWVVILVICWDLQTWSDRLSCDTIDMLRPSDLIHTFVLFHFQTLFEFKYEFLTKVSEHEHYIPLSLPLMRKGMIKTFKGMYLAQYQIVVASWRCSTNNNVYIPIS
jgi:hypothetical protein